MKTIDFKQYNEKLKINPVRLSEFENICTGFEDIHNFKNKIKNLDIVQFRNNDYAMAFVGERGYECILKVYSEYTIISQMKSHRNEIIEQGILANKYWTILFQHYNDKMVSLKHNEVDVFRIWHNIIDISDKDYMMKEDILCNKNLDALLKCDYYEQNYINNENI